MIRRLAAALATTTCIMALATPAAAETREYDIPAGSLKQALDAYVHQSGRQIVYRADEVRSARSSGARGPLSADAALDAVLSESGFTTRVDGKLVAIVKLGNGRSVAGEREASYGESNSSAARNDQTSEITVTGTNIAGQSPVGSPITTYTRKDVARSGVGTLDQFIRTIPQNFASIDPSGSTLTSYSGGGFGKAPNNAGGATVNLHGIGEVATLTLVNGHRLAPGGDQGNIVDISRIPLAAIERVEILSDGASAVYGSDAIGGVVNFILRKDYDGIESSARYGATTQGGGNELNISQTFGKAWSTGNALLTYSYSDQTPYYAKQRDFIDLSPPNTIDRDFALSPKQKTHSFVAQGRQDITDRITAYADGLYGNRQVKANLAFNGSGLIYDIKTRLVGVNAGLQFKIANNWKLALESLYSSNLEDYTYTLSTSSGEYIYGSRTRNKTSVGTLSAKLEGSLMTLPSGEVRVAIGGVYRLDRFSFSDPIAYPIKADRNNKSLFAEGVVPLLSSANERPLFRSLVISFAGRYDSYSDFGHAFTPKVGIEWKPIRSLKLRASWGKAFRAPELARIAATPETIISLLSPDPQNPAGTVLLLRSGNNPSLRPERANTYSAGIDFSPEVAQRLRTSINYFRVKYRNRISSPAVNSLYTALTQSELASFVTRSPSVEFGQTLLDDAALAGTYFPLDGPVTGESVQAIFDQRLQNIAETLTSGLDASLQYTIPTGTGSLGVSLTGTYILSSSQRPFPGGSRSKLVSIPFNPVDLRVRAGVDWTDGALSASVIGNYFNKYRNTLTSPVSKVRSWLTFDVQVAYELPRGPSFLQGWQVSLSAQNLFDRAPPRLTNPSASASNVGFDPTNATLRGRFLALQLTKSW